MSQNLYDLIGLLAGICFILALKGLSSPKSARRGNIIGAIGATIATVIVFFYANDGKALNHLPLILGAIAFGVLVGVPAARKVQMTQMPQLVALFNGVGGGAAALVAIVEYLKLGDSATVAEVVATVFTVIVGCVSFSGSIITFLKLQELMTTRPVIFPFGRQLIALTLLAVLATGGWVISSGGTAPLLINGALSLLFGILFVLPVGGADVPIVISLLNAFTGLTVAASGYVLQTTLLIIAGTLVGASGTILTRLMAEAMGRSLFGTLFGAFTAKATAATGAAESRPVKSGSPDDVAILLNYAQRVVIVPGFGLAVAQAQHTVRELADLLTAKGVDVAYGIHPVAGRMPGHMNVLLAEANVPYEQLVEMEEVNPTFPQTDVVLVVGANDVVNPAAKTTPGCPIYGMPILEVDKAGNVIFLKRSMRPGFAGIENELLYEPKTTLLFGDAKDSLTKVVSALKAL
ncbi:MAG: NAD(P)(+) transhydrogenase (Re/Si-specific) subunit beta [Actinobacteria bacterium]|jgi:NAD(P) transhydrogenase subunit beta|uniref:NAD(P) transhydrogenase subunit beta n=1 Tax=freshwater metagenome TaxID=449393 RepID=A0A6J6Y8G0_9ZZZZ|nr:NAD(P)(+) transhydrogenase (Re/Si-specific) subunit beta [Actinomycetota bacterium]MSX69221.1 NAD(P)(+) transhydrogenase (Re/Si-specific) subunit beta [Actinomycetota bacterium]MSY15976.1 NAD(P)(+) transhydrogenase (Re/Si-specific) subunit beta [Actinomycetota bacterium]MTA98300.1 NAD(P)(+) transhydrogenase (Re/Si-specific) subunit beta [Actinomycetota bacterium]